MISENWTLRIMRQSETSETGYDIVPVGWFNAELEEALMVSLKRMMQEIPSGVGARPTMVKMQQRGDGWSLEVGYLGDRLMGSVFGSLKQGTED